MGDGENAPLRLQFNPKVRLEFHGSTITSTLVFLPFESLMMPWPTFPIWVNIPLSKSSAFFKPLSICETLAVGMAIITP